MAWFIPERRGPQWRQGWWGQTMANLSLPPPHFLAFFLLVVFLLSLTTWYDGDYSRTKLARRTAVGFRLFLVFLPPALIVATACMFKDGRRFAFRLPGSGGQETLWKAGSSPWWVAGLVVLLLYMVYYQSSFHSKWFKGLWKY